MELINKVLIVDDSRIFRGKVQKILEDTSDISIIGSVMNAKKAMETIKIERPDVILFDYNLPELNGYDFLKMLKEYVKNEGIERIGVIMLIEPEHAEHVEPLLSKGAFYCIIKPKILNQDDDLGQIKQILIAKIHAYSRQKLMEGINPSQAPTPFRQQSTEFSLPENTLHKKEIKVIVIASSTGGPKALAEMLPELVKKIDLPILIVQHMPPDFTASLATSLNSKCQESGTTVVEAHNGDIVEKKTVYIAPSGLHMLTHKQLDGTVSIELLESPPEEGVRPCANLLFNSTGKIYKEKILAIVLTGMGRDGTAGVQELKKYNSHVIAQDEATSVVWGMPGSIVEAGLADQIIPLMEIPNAVHNYVEFNIITHKKGNL